MTKSKCCEKCYGAFGVIGCKGKSSCPCHYPKENKEEWQVKFLNFGTAEGLGDLSIMISIVSEIREEAYRQGHDEAIKWEREADNGVAKAVAEERERIKKFVKNSKIAGDDIVEDVALGYNRALDDILNLI